jgi:putative flippase GtrA
VFERSSVLTFGRHQLVSLVATAVDFSVMVGAVSLLHQSPVTGTMIGATFGAITSFSLGRQWAFAAHHGHPGRQAMRYVLVSVGGLGWNALGEWLLAIVVGIHFVLARAIVSLVIGWVWNFPMHRHFVFRPKRISRSRPDLSPERL